MRIAGFVSLAVGAAAVVFLALGSVGAVGGNWAGYTCLAVCAVLFGGAGFALLAGSRVLPKDWPPPDDRPGPGGDDPA